MLGKTTINARKRNKLGMINMRMLTRHIRQGDLGPSRAAGSHVLANVISITLFLALSASLHSLAGAAAIASTPGTRSAASAVAACDAADVAVKCSLDSVARACLSTFASSGKNQYDSCRCHAATATATATVALRPSTFTSPGQRHIIIFFRKEGGAAVDGRALY